MHVKKKLYHPYHTCHTKKEESKLRKNTETPGEAGAWHGEGRLEGKTEPEGIVDTRKSGIGSILV